MPTKLENLKAEYNYILNTGYDSWDQARREKYGKFLRVEGYTERSWKDICDLIWGEILDEYERIVEEKREDWLSIVFPDIESKTFGSVTTTRLRFPSEVEKSAVPGFGYSETQQIQTAKNCISKVREAIRQRKEGELKEVYEKL